MDQLVKFLGKLAWVVLIILLLFWFFQNKEDFFPARSVPYIPNPVNPFK